MILLSSFTIIVLCLILYRSPIDVLSMFCCYYYVSCRVGRAPPDPPASDPASDWW